MGNAVLLRKPLPLRERYYTHIATGSAVNEVESVASSVPPSPSAKSTDLPDLSSLADFPRYRKIQSKTEIAAYLANASYVVSLGGPPLADLEYGVIIVPAGTEIELFGRKPDHVVN